MADAVGTSRSSEEANLMRCMCCGKHADRSSALSKAMCVGGAEVKKKKQIGPGGLHVFVHSRWIALWRIGDPENRLPAHAARLLDTYEPSIDKFAPKTKEIKAAEKAERERLEAD